MDGISKSELSETFDHVVVVNLTRRPERIERFWTLLGDWPFKKPKRFEAVDGQAVGTPAGWDKGPGAWGCLLSHRQILNQAIRDGVRSLLVLEDDAFPVENFAVLAAEFLRNVPQDWDGLMLGAEHLQKPQPIRAGVARCVASNRTHAYAVRGRFMDVLSQFWESTTNDHCDIVLSSLMRHFNVYTPDPLLIGQDCGHSDVTERREYLRFLSGDQKEKIAESDSRYLIEKVVVRVPVGRGIVSSQQARAMP
jgi:GR25 family glycosyltransferase involved in LPS biosynthesis